jgi:hypothetical protein
MKDKNVSSLGKHFLEKKKGVLASPWNHMVRQTNMNFHTNSWNRERLPEYLWIGIIFSKYGRKDGFDKLFPVLKYISTVDNSITFPKLSSILSLTSEKQEKIYQKILEHVEKSVIAPLTAIINADNYPIFYKYFNDNTMLIEKRIGIIRETIRKLWDHQSNESTDVRYLALSLLLFNNRLHIGPETEDTAKALACYSKIEHDDEHMRIYRPIVRSMEGIDFEQTEYSFSEYFWREISMLDKCDLYYIEFDKGDLSKKEIIKDTKEALDYVSKFYKNEQIHGDKFSVLSGSLCYALKIFEEIISKDLGNSILGRHGLRTIIEMLIIIKYLIKNEINHPNIWKEYKQYGIGKFKLILLKSREKKDREKLSHFNEAFIDILVNENTWEEFQDIDLKYFDRIGIREKCIEIDEKELYDILYDYDSSYVHGLWGAIRESSILACNNPNHLFHSIPDIFNAQKQADIIFDTEIIFLKLLSIFNSQYFFPKWFYDKYIGSNNG